MIKATIGSENIINYYGLCYVKDIDLIYYNNTNNNIVNCNIDILCQL